MTHSPELARDLWRLIEPIHAVTYFSPEAAAAFDDVGYRGFWMGYFAGRAAPLGSVGPEVVTALFYNFAPSRVARALPDAWGFALPVVALEARVLGAVRTLERMFVGVATESDVAAAAALVRRAAQSADCGGRALAAANAVLPWPEDDIAMLWQGTTLLREHRGDGHVAALIAAGISGRESHVLQVAAGRTDRDVMTRARDIDETEWAELADGLAVRGLVTRDLALTDTGHALKMAIEDETDRSALSAYTELDGGEIEQLMDAVAPLAAAVVAAGDIPAVNAIGLPIHGRRDVRSVGPAVV